MTDVKHNPLEATLRRIATEQDYKDYRSEIKPIYSGGANYSSRLYVAKLSAPGKDDLKLFAKLAIDSEKFREQMPIPAYEYEQYAYNVLAKIYEKIYTKYNVSKEARFSMPVMYGCDGSDRRELLVLQDLGAEGFSTQDRFVSFDWQYASAAVTQLAYFHAINIAFSQEFPEEFAKAAKWFSYHFGADDIFTKSMIKTIGRTLPAIKEENRARVEAYLGDLKTRLAELFQFHIHSILIHGDFRMSNMMHKVEKNGTVKIVVVDYQTLRMGSVVNDLLYFVFAGSDGPFRRRHFQQLTDLYYEQLSLSLTRLHLDPHKVFPRADFDKELKELMPIGLLFTLFLSPALLVAEDGAAPLNEELDMEAIVNVELNDLCKERINQAVDDYISWGLL